VIIYTEIVMVIFLPLQSQYILSLLLFVVDNGNIFIEVCTGSWWGSLRERDQWQDQDVDGRITLRWNFRKLEGVVGTGWSWLRIGTGGEHLWVQ
jgi:hypothetical protein